MVQEDVVVGCSTKSDITPAVVRAQGAEVQCGDYSAALHDLHDVRHAAKEQEEKRVREG